VVGTNFPRAARLGVFEGIHLTNSPRHSHSALDRGKAIFLWEGGIKSYGETGTGIEIGDKP